MENWEAFLHDLKNDPEPEPVEDAITDQLDAQLARAGNQVPALDPFLVADPLVKRESKTPTASRALLDRLFARADANDHNFIETLRRVQEEYDIE